MKILLATDGSDNANAAVDFLLKFPFPEPCSVTLLTVIDAHLFVDIDAFELSSEQHEALLVTNDTVRQEVQQSLDGQAARIVRDGWTIETLVKTGYIAEEIINTAEELQADLVVVGAHGVTGHHQFRLGSVATRLLNYAHCSVLIVKDTPESELQAGETLPPEDWRVLLAYDDSGPARQALALCESLPLGERDEVAVLTVVTLITAYRQDIRQQMNSIWQQKKIAAKASHDGAVARLRGSLPSVSSRMREGDNSAHEVIEEATESGSNLIVLGNKGKKAIKRFLLGSMTSHVARHAPCSVWVVRD
jgi:nucleotide-binding universal stress UspA family protein